MRRLQSFYAILATIFAVAASILTFFLVCIFGIPDMGLLLWFLFAGTAFAFTLSLVIGHYLAEPLTDLHVRAKRFFMETRASILSRKASFTRPTSLPKTSLP